MLRPPPPLLALGCLALAYAVHRVVPTPALAPPPWNLLGMVVAGAGLALAASAIRAFRARCTTVHPWRQPEALVTEGPYRRTRNPMYVGLVLLTLGVALLVGTAAMLLAPVLLFVALDRWVVPWEERAAEAAFGAPYRAYRARVHRWL